MKGSKAFSRKYTTIYLSVVYTHKLLCISVYIYIYIHSTYTGTAWSEVHHELWGILSQGI